MPASSRFPARRWPLSPFVAVVLVAALSGCAAPRAVVYTEENPAQRASARRALEQCERHARDSIGLNARQGAAARSAGTTGAVAALAAAAGALVEGTTDVATALAAGGAAGAVGALTRSALGWRHPDKAYEAHVKICMDRRGHAVAGWR